MTAKMLIVDQRDPEVLPTGAEHVTSYDEAIKKLSGDMFDIVITAAKIEGETKSAFDVLKHIKEMIDDGPREVWVCHPSDTCEVNVGNTTTTWYLDPRLQANYSFAQHFEGETGGCLETLLSNPKQKCA